MKKNLSKTFLLIALFFLVSGSLFFLIGYQELKSLESEYTKEELFKLCSEGKVDMYGCVTGGAW
ncbi:hypothetical protein N8269_02825 [Candidatus Thioglobus sp.]|nr:hypothetical protein [Candidatus Thioglobus sp.]